MKFFSADVVGGVPSDAPVEAPATDVVADSPPSPANDEVVDAPSDAAEGAPPPFDWEAWDGSIDLLPEEHRELGGHISRHFSSKLEAAQADVSRLQEWVDALSLDEEPKADAAQAPVVDTTELETLKAALVQREKDLEVLTREYEEAKAGWDDFELVRAQEEVAQFKEKYPEFWANEELGKQLEELIEDDWNMFLAAELIKLGPEAIQYGREARAEGASPKHALKLAQLQVSMSKPKPRASAALVNGAGPSSKPTATSRGPEDAKSAKELRELVAEKVLRIHQR